MRKGPFDVIPEIRGERIVLKRIGPESAPGLLELVESEAVYRYLPTFLFEKKYDVNTVISRLYTECMKESMILGIYIANDFCGIAEAYGYRENIHKISVGYRLSEKFWGKGVASEALGLMVDYLLNETDIEIITASSMVENRRSARVLEKNGFSHVISGVCEDWGFEDPVLVDKWIR